MNSPRRALRSHPTAIAITIAVVIGITSLLAALNLFGGSLGVMLAGGDVNAINSASCAFAVACTILAFLVTRQALRNSFSIWFIRLLIALYLLALVWVSLFKSVGVRDINLNPGDIVSQMRYAPESLLANVLMYVPLGALVRVKSSRYRTIILTGLGVSLAFELIQYAFALGILDVVDIVANGIGAMAGFVAVGALGNHGLRLVPAESGHVSVSFSPKHAAPSLRRRLLAVAAGTTCAFVIGLVALFVLSSLAPESSASLPPPSFSPSVTLATLPEGDAGISDPADERTPGTSPEGDEIALEARVLGSVSWTADDGTPPCQGIDILSEEILPNGVRVSRIVPAVLTEDADIQVKGRNVDLEEAAQLFSQTTWWSARGSLALEDGWLRVTQLQLNEDQTLEVDAEAPIASFPWGAYDDLELTGDAELVDGMADGDTATVSGYVTSQQIPEGGPASMVLCIPSHHLDVPLIEAYRVCLPQPEALGADQAGDAGHLAEFSLRLQDSGLMLTD